MTFQIDTGTAPSPLDRIPDWFRDTYPDERDVARIVHDYGYHLIGAMNPDNPNNPKTVATVRKHMLAAWWFIRDLAEMHPDVFDELMTAYAERVAAA